MMSVAVLRCAATPPVAARASSAIKTNRTLKNGVRAISPPIVEGYASALSGNTFERGGFHPCFSIGRKDRFTRGIRLSRDERSESAEQRRGWPAKDGAT